jgi:hypothetical protein
MGFYQVKFSHNDSIIVGHGYEMDIFYDAISGNEINRIPGNNEVFFFNNDLNFIKLSSQRNCFEIFDTKTYLVIDTLENDSTKLIQHYSLSNDQSKLVCVKLGGLKMWDMVTRKVVLSKNFSSIPGLKEIQTGKVGFNCDGKNILVRTKKTYQISVSPPKEISEDYVTVFDSNTLDSINSFYGLTYFEFSHNCQYIAFQMPNDKNGVVIYDFNTKKIKKILPINGFSLTGIEFSPDDKYIVTSNGPGANSLIVWDALTGVQKYGYSETSFENIDISNSGKNLVFSVGRRIKLLNTKFDGVSLPLIPEIYKILYPNPSSGEVNIHNEYSGKIKIFNSRGNLQEEIEPSPLENGIRFSVSSFPNGEYFIVLEGKEKTTYKLIINK